MILPPATLGMLGGGQLGRFFVIAAREMGYRVVVLDPDPHSPAGRIADLHLVSDFEDADALDRMASECSAVSTEFENVPADSLAYLSKFIPVRPSSGCVAIAQDRIREKRYMRENSFPVAPFAVVLDEADVAGASGDLFPGVLKVSRFGYDGKGQARVANIQELRLAFHRFDGEPCVLERFLALDCELSVVVARSQDGDARCFPAAENRHRHGILDVSIAPAEVDARLHAEAEDVALSLARRLDYVGVVGVEFFVADGRLLINEIAPRPHNSGHYTIDACLTNQFEQQVRTLCGLPLGDPHQHSAATMVNLLGDVWFSNDPHHAREPDWSRLLAVPNLSLHLYGKHHPRPGRKMGHFTVVGPELRAVVDAAFAARRQIGIIDDA
jgi:5-(carboxyamino)imidazole ribonucleotide synthase